MRYMWLAVALLLGLALVWLGFYAAADDGYYTSGDVSRWDHAARWGTTPIVVVAAAIASTIALAFVFQGLFPGRLTYRWLAIPALAVYFLSFAVAWFFLTAGH